MLFLYLNLKIAISNLEKEIEVSSCRVFSIKDKSSSELKFENFQLQTVHLYSHIIQQPYCFTVELKIQHPLCS